MTAQLRKAIRLVGSRIVIAAVSAALIAVGGQNLAVLPKLVARNVVETASIVQEPTTVGIADSNLYNQSEADINRTLDTLQAMGVNDIRIIIPWAGVQPLPFQMYYWTNVDRMVNAAAARNMGVLAVLNSTPAWASNRYLSGHPDPAQFADFASLVAQRYQGKIAAYEVWNEPNAITFWNPVDPVAYTHLLQAGYTAIKAADPSALVIGGVVASVFTAGNVTINPQDFVAQMYAAGAKGYFDAISFHPYHYFLPFSEGGKNPLSALDQVDEIRKVMDENGDSNLKIWATEYGLPTAEVAPGDVVTEQQQANFISDFLSTWPSVDGAGPAFIYTFRDSYSGDPDVQKNFGIFYTDWTPKLAAKVIAEFAGGQLPQEPTHPILDAALAITQAIVNAVSRLIHAGAQLFAAAVNVTVQVIKGLIDLGVRVVKGLASATVTVIKGVVDAIGQAIDAIRDRLGSANAATAAKTALRLPAPTGKNSVVSPMQTSESGAKASSATSASTSGPDSSAVATITKTTAVPKNNGNNSSNKTASTTRKANTGTATSDATEASTAKADAASSKQGAGSANGGNATNDASDPSGQDTKDPKKNS